MIVARHRTAIHRHRLSRPLAVAIEDGLLTDKDLVFDYGCGHGDDIARLRESGIPCEGWDPSYRPTSQITPSDVVNLGYVINVIENPQEREAVLHNAWSLTRKLLVVSARLDVEAKGTASSRYEDGYLTRLETFQKYFEQRELREWIDGVLSEESIPAGPGIFYVFRDTEAKQSFLVSRYKRSFATPRLRTSTILFERHKTLLEPLMDFFSSKGRLPAGPELIKFSEIQDSVGSLRQAFRIIVRVTGEDQWEQIRRQRSQDLLVYLALAKFARRPRFSEMSPDLQLDIKAFFRTFKKACDLADQLLFSVGNPDLISQECRKSPVGKLTPGSLYVHVSALPSLSPILRVYEGCARAYIGAVEGANIVKLKHRHPQVSYLAYPDFERDPHPALFGSLVVPLQTFRIQYREYAESPNPPVLHRKELFLASNHELRSKFERLTKQEEKYGLYERVDLIGTKQGWEETLKTRGVRVSGHKVMRLRTSKTDEAS